MKYCDECHKKEATIHYTEIINGKYKELHLCKDCAEKKNLFNPQFDFLGANSSALNNSINEPEKDLKCENCGLTYQKFKENGKLGCSECYKNFYEILKNLLSRIHNNTQHTGKEPLSKSGKMKNYQEIKKLKQELQNCVNSEDYEKAILIRDKLKKLQ